MNQYPGTNFHDLNLNWLLNEMKNCLTEWASTKEDWEDLETDNAAFKERIESEWDSFEDYVRNYLTNLDVSQEINAKIDAMIESGEFRSIIINDVVSQTALTTASWLNSHITQETGYVLDDTLTVPGAAADAKAAGDRITELKSAIIYTEKHGINLWNPNDVSVGSINADGTINPDSTDFRYTNYYVPVSSGDIVSTFYDNATATGVICFYDTNKNFISRLVGATVTAPADGYFRIRWDVNTGSGSSMTCIGSYDVVPAYERYANVLVNPDNTIYGGCLYVGSSRTSGNNSFTMLKPCCDFIIANNIKNAIVYVDAGTYDLRVEFTLRILNAIDASTNIGYGLHIGNNTRFVFAEGAFVKFLYDGTSVQCSEYFSPFNIVGSCILENANIEVTNARYCVHEDTPSATNNNPPAQYTIKYINCVMKHNGNNMGTYTGTVCIGAGTMRNSLSVIEGGEYTCGSQFPWAISYHNFYKATWGDKPSKVVLNNVWISNGLRLGTFGDSVVDVIVSNCKMPSGLRSYDSQYFNVKQWNNITA